MAGPTEIYGHLHALVAEDDPLIAMDIEQTLVGHFGLRVTVVHALKSAMATLQRDPPDLAVLDLNLAGDGVEPLAGVLMEAQTPIVYVSGYRSPPMADPPRVWRLEKPHSSEQLIEIIGDAIRLARS